MNVDPFIEAERAGRRNVKRACALGKVSRAALSAHRFGASRREQEDAESTRRIREVHEESQGRDGAPHIHAELASRGQCWDNALSESFFASLNGELIGVQAWATAPCPAGDRGRHRLVQRHPAAQHTRPQDTRRTRRTRQEARRHEVGTSKEAGHGQDQL